MAKDIELLFGVKGGGSPSGQSGTMIRGAIDEILKEPFNITVNIRNLAQIRQKLEMMIDSVVTSRTIPIDFTATGMENVKDGMLAIEKAAKKSSRAVDATTNSISGIGVGVKKVDTSITKFADTAVKKIAGVGDAAAKSTDDIKALAKQTASMSTPNFEGSGGKATAGVREMRDMVAQVGEQTANTGAVIESLSDAAKSAGASGSQAMLDIGDASQKAVVSIDIVCQRFQELADRLGVTGFGERIDDIRAGLEQLSDMGVVGALDKALDHTVTSSTLVSLGDIITDSVRDNCKDSSYIIDQFCKSVVSQFTYTVSVVGPMTDKMLYLAGRLKQYVNTVIKLSSYDPEYVTVDAESLIRKTFSKAGAKRFGYSSLDDMLGNGGVQTINQALTELIPLLGKAVECYDSGGKVVFRVTDQIGKSVDYLRQKAKVIEATYDTYKDYLKLVDAGAKATYYSYKKGLGPDSEFSPNIVQITSPALLLKEQQDGIIGALRHFNRIVKSFQIDPKTMDINEITSSILQAAEATRSLPSAPIQNVVTAEEQVATKAIDMGDNISDAASKGITSMSQLGEVIDRVRAKFVEVYGSAPDSFESNYIESTKSELEKLGNVDVLSAFSKSLGDIKMPDAFTDFLAVPRQIRNGEADIEEFTRIVNSQFSLFIRSVNSGQYEKNECFSVLLKSLIEMRESLGETKVSVKDFYTYLDSCLTDAQKKIIGLYSNNDFNRTALRTAMYGLERNFPDALKYSYQDISMRDGIDDVYNSLIEVQSEYVEANNLQNEFFNALIKYGAIRERGGLNTTLEQLNVIKDQFPQAQQYISEIESRVTQSIAQATDDGEERIGKFQSAIDKFSQRLTELGSSNPDALQWLGVNDLIDLEDAFKKLDSWEVVDAFLSGISKLTNLDNFTSLFKDVVYGAEDFVRNLTTIDRIISQLEAHTAYGLERELKQGEEISFISIDTLKSKVASLTSDIWRYNEAFWNRIAEGASTISNLDINLFNKIYSALNMTESIEDFERLASILRGLGSDYDNAWVGLQKFSIAFKEITGIDFNSFDALDARLKQTGTDLTGMAEQSDATTANLTQVSDAAEQAAVSIEDVLQHIQDIYDKSGQPFNQSQVDKYISQVGQQLRQINDPRITAALNEALNQVVTTDVFTTLRYSLYGAVKNGVVDCKAVIDNLTLDISNQFVKNLEIIEPIGERIIYLARMLKAYATDTSRIETDGTWDPLTASKLIEGYFNNNGAKLFGYKNKKALLESGEQGIQQVQQELVDFAKQFDGILTYVYNGSTIIFEITERLTPAIDRLLSRNKELKALYNETQKYRALLDAGAFSEDIFSETEKYIVQTGYGGIETQKLSIETFLDRVKEAVSEFPALQPVIDAFMKSFFAEPKTTNEKEIRALIQQAAESVGPLSNASSAMQNLNNVSKQTADSIEIVCKHFQELGTELGADGIEDAVNGVRYALTQLNDPSVIGALNEALNNTVTRDAWSRLGSSLTDSVNSGCADSAAIIQQFCDIATKQFLALLTVRKPLSSAMDYLIGRLSKYISLMSQYDGYQYPYIDVTADKLISRTFSDSGAKKFGFSNVQDILDSGTKIIEQALVELTSMLKGTVEYYQDNAGNVFFHITDQVRNAVKEVRSYDKILKSEFADTKGYLKLIDAGAQSTSYGSLKYMTEITAPLELMEEYADKTKGLSVEIDKVRDSFSIEPKTTNINEITSSILQAAEDAKTAAETSTSAYIPVTKALDSVAQSTQTVVDTSKQLPEVANDLTQIAESAQDAGVSTVKAMQDISGASTQASDGISDVTSAMGQIANTSAFINYMPTWKESGNEGKELILKSLIEIRDAYGTTQQTVEDFYTYLDGHLNDAQKKDLSIYGYVDFFNHSIKEWLEILSANGDMGLTYSDSGLITIYDNIDDAYNSLVNLKDGYSAAMATQEEFFNALAAHGAQYTGNGLYVTIDQLQAVADIFPQAKQCIDEIASGASRINIDTIATGFAQIADSTTQAGDAAEVAGAKYIDLANDMQLASKNVIEPPNTGELIPYTVTGEVVPPDAVSNMKQFNEAAKETVDSINGLSKGTQDFTGNIIYLPASLESATQTVQAYGDAVKSATEQGGTATNIFSPESVDTLRLILEAIGRIEAALRIIGETAANIKIVDPSTVAAINSLNSALEGTKSIYGSIQSVAEKCIEAVTTLNNGGGGGGGGGNGPVSPPDDILEILKQMLALLRQINEAVAQISMPKLTIDEANLQSLRQQIEDAIAGTPYKITLELADSATQILNDLADKLKGITIPVTLATAAGTTPNEIGGNIGDELQSVATGADAVSAAIEKTGDAANKTASIISSGAEQAKSAINSVRDAVDTVPVGPDKATFTLNHDSIDGFENAVAGLSVGEDVVNAIRQSLSTLDIQVNEINSTWSHTVSMIEDIEVESERFVGLTVRGTDQMGNLVTYAGKYNTTLGEISYSQTSITSNLEAQRKAEETKKNTLDKYNAAIESTGTKIEALVSKFNQLANPTENLKKNMEELQGLFKSYSGLETDDERIQAFERMSTLIKQCKSEMADLQTIQKNDSVAKLKEQMSALEQTISTLQTTSVGGVQKNAVDELVSQFNTLKDEINSIQAPTELSAEKIKELEKRVTSLINAANGQKKINFDTNAGSLLDQLKTLDEGLKSLRKDNESTNILPETTINVLNSQLEAVGRIRNALQQLKGDKILPTEDFERYSSEIERISSDLQRWADTYNTQLTNQKGMDSIASQIVAIEDSLSQLNDMKLSDDVSAKAQEWGAKLGNLTSRFYDIQRDAPSAAAEIEKLGTEVTALENSINNATLMTFNENLRSLRNSVKQVEGGISSALGSEYTTQFDISELHAASNEIENIKNNLRYIQQPSDLSGTVNQDFLDSLAEAQAKVDVARSSIDATKESLARLEAYSTEAGKTLGKFVPERLTDEQRQELERLTAQYNEYKEAVERATQSVGPGMIDSEQIANANRLYNALKPNIDAFYELASSERTSARALAEKERAIKSAINALTQMQNAERNWTKAKNGTTSDEYNKISGYIEQMQDLIAIYRNNEIGTDEFKEKVAALGAQFADTKNKITAAGEATSALGNKTSGLARAFSMYFSATRVIMYVIRLLRQAVTNVKEIDSALTQLKIVTGASDTAMEGFLTKSTTLAKELGQSITDVLSSVETFSRLGYSLEDSSVLAKYAGILSNVAGVEVDDATTGLTSIIKGYNMDVNNAEHVADVLVEVGRKYAVSASEMIEAYEKSGAALSATNTSFEKSAGLIAAANAAVELCRAA